MSSWQLRFGKDGETSRYVSNDDYVISVSPIPGLMHLLGPVTKEHDDGFGPKRDLIALAEIGNWQEFMGWVSHPSGVAPLPVIANEE